MIETASLIPEIHPLLNEERLNELGPGSPNVVMRKPLEQAAVVIAVKARNREAGLACVAGLWLYHDFLDESHTISQDLHTSEGSYWHAIMHRREPDAWNSNYWFRRVGAHPLIQQLIEQAPALGYPYRSPAAFIDFCERVRGAESSDEMLARRVQQLEWQLLFEHCYRQAML